MEKNDFDLTDLEIDIIKENDNFVSQGVQTDVDSDIWNELDKKINIEKKIDVIKKHRELIKIKDTIPVDMVITYVDGNDINYINKKNDFIIKNNLSVEFHPEIRSVNIDEIKYCVSSVLKFIPWIRKIFIITDNQIPPINNQLIESGKVVIIDHKDIIEEKYLPTFNSDVIESYMHKINDLSKFFLYNNDDIFNLDYIKREDIYDIMDADIKFKIKGRFNIRNYARNSGEYARRIVYTAKYLRKKFSTIQLFNNHHTKILRKSTMTIVEKYFPKMLDDMRKCNFRSVGYIQYLFFVTNIDNLLHKNIVENDFSEVIELHFNDKEYKEIMFSKIDKNYKYVCLNSMNSTFKEPFENLMEKIGLEPV